MKPILCLTLIALSTPLLFPYAIKNLPPDYMAAFSAGYIAVIAAGLLYSIIESSRPKYQNDGEAEFSALDYWT